MSNLMMTNEMIGIMKLQRTGTLNKPHPVRLFESQLKEDLNEIIEHCPLTSRIVWDIGCGIGGIDLYLQRYYDCDLWLMDKNEIAPEIYYGYHGETSAYNRLDITRKFLELNGVKSSKINTVEACNGYRLPEKAHIILSLISCGFHYPVKTYLDDMLANIHQFGTVILDIRRDTGQIDLLKKHFRQVKIIREYQKHERVACNESIIV